MRLNLVNLSYKMPFFKKERSGPRVGAGLTKGKGKKCKSETSSKQGMLGGIPGAMGSTPITKKAK